jgi:hypothetical protein
MYRYEVEHRHLGTRTIGTRRDAMDAPPTWAVVVVKACVIGLLLLPVAVFLWAIMYTPPDGVGVAPIAFLASIMLGLGMFGTAAYLTTTFPPVRDDEQG